MKEEKIKLEIAGMTCDHCATGIKKCFHKMRVLKKPM